jgi:hypothetical protein
MTKMTLPLVLFAATCLAGCVTETPAVQPQASASGTPRLTGEPSSVDILIPRLAARGLTMEPLPASRAAAIRTYCTGGAEALALTTPFTDAEAQACVDMGGGWSASLTFGQSTYLSRSLAASNFDDFS